MHCDLDGMMIIYGEMERITEASFRILSGTRLELQTKSTKKTSFRIASAPF